MRKLPNEVEALGDGKGEQIMNLRNEAIAVAAQVFAKRTVCETNWLFRDMVV